MKKEQGITLISLVVTIIVLIILAGISVNLILGQDGIINRAKDAKTKQEIGEIKEKIGLDILDAQMEAISRNESLEQEQLEDIISKYGQLQEDKDTIILKDDKGTLSLIDIYNGTTITEGSYSENKAKIELLERQVEILKEQLDNASDDTKELIELKETLDKATVTADKILKDYTAYKDGELITGKIEDRGAWNNTPTTSGKVTIPAGYHNGSGYVDTSTVYNNAYSEGYKNGNETTNQTIVLYFGGKEILASDKIYGSTSCSGTWANTAFGPYTVIESVDPKIFSTLRCQGNFWGGSASGNSPGVGIDGGSAVLSFIDTVTGETVYTRNVGGRPYNVTIDLLSLNLTNPFRLQYQSTGHMSTWGDPTGQAYLKEVYLKVRDDYQG